MFDLVVDLFDAEQAESKARISYEAVSAAQPEEFNEIMDVAKDLGDGDPEMHVKLVRAREAVAEVAELKGHVVAVVGGAWFREIWSRYRKIIESSSLSTVGNMQKRLVRVATQRRPRIQGRCSKSFVGSGVKRSLDILFNNINDWSKKAAAFFLQRRPRVALFVEHHVAAAALHREREVWERHGYRLFM